MKNLSKFSLVSVSLGLLLIYAYQMKQRPHHQTEDRILKRLQSRFADQTVKGTWIQYRTHYYVGAVTIMVDQRLINHSFTADRRGRLISIN